MCTKAVNIGREESLALQNSFDLLGKLFFGKKSRDESDFASLLWVGFRPDGAFSPQSVAIEQQVRDAQQVPLQVTGQSSSSNRVTKAILTPLKQYIAS